MKGTFIVIDGLDGAGKTSVINYLESLFAGCENVIFTREPGGTPEAEELREFFLKKRTPPLEKETEILIVEATRAEHLAKVILPAVMAGKLVISDRFDASTYVYNVPSDNDHLEKLFSQANHRLLRKCSPDAYIFLDLPPEVSLSRSQGRGDESRFDAADITTYTERRARYKEFFRKYTQHRNVTIINAEQSLHDVCIAVRKVISQALGIKT